MIEESAKIYSPRKIFPLAANALMMICVKIIAPSYTHRKRAHYDRVQEEYIRRGANPQRGTF